MKSDGGKSVSPLFSVYTAREAEKIWGLGTNTVAKWCQRGKFLPDEARKSEKTWLVTSDGMKRLTSKKHE